MLFCFYFYVICFYSPVGGVLREADAGIVCVNGYSQIVDFFFVVVFNLFSGVFDVNFQGSFSERRQAKTYCAALNYKPYRSPS